MKTIITLLLALLCVSARAQIYDHGTNLTVYGAATIVGPLTNSGVWPYVAQVPAGDATTTGQSLVDVTGLTFPAVASATYEFEALLFCTTTAVTTGTEYGIANIFTNVSTFFCATGFTNVAGTGPAPTYTIGATNTATPPFLLASGQTGIVMLKGVFVTGAGTAPTISVRHLKVNSGTSTVKQGSTFKVRRLF